MANKGHLRHTVAHFNAINRERHATVVEAKQVAHRIRELKQVVHDTFPFSIYKQAKDRCRELGKVGGKDYNAVLKAVKSIQWKLDTEQHIKEVDWDEAVNLVTR